jgi:hypothetical protein
MTIKSSIGQYWALWLVALFKIFFLCTFSPNIGGDSANYLRMLIEGKSNLIHAPGYPFLMGIPWRLDIFSTLVEGHAEYFYRLLVLIQHLISFGVMIWFYRNVKHCFGGSVANISVLIWGLHYGSLGSQSIIYPEWLQSMLFVATLILLYKAYLATSLKYQVGYFAMAGFFFAWCYLVKFNAMVFAACFLVVLFALSAKVSSKILIGTSALISFAVVVGLFASTFHYAQTKTYSLSHDKAWVLLYSLSKFVPGDSLDANTGLNTKRLILLNNLLPWDNKNVGPIWDVDQVSPDSYEYRSK